MPGVSDMFVQREPRRGVRHVKAGILHSCKAFVSVLPRTVQYNEYQQQLLAHQVYPDRCVTPGIRRHVIDLGEEVSCHKTTY